MFADKTHSSAEEQGSPFYLRMDQNDQKKMFCIFAATMHLFSQYIEAMIQKEEHHRALNSCFKIHHFWGDKYEVQILLHLSNFLPLKVKGGGGLQIAGHAVQDLCFSKTAHKDRLDFLQGNILYEIKSNLGMGFSFWRNKCLHKLCLPVWILHNIGKQNYVLIILVPS